MDSTDQRIDLIDALGKLSPSQRKAIILWAQGYTHEEIADEMGVSERTVKRYTLTSRSLLCHYLGTDPLFNSEGSV